MNERISAIAPTRAERTCDRGRNAATHTAVRGMLNQHHKRKGERHAGERIRAKFAEKQPVEGYHAGNRKKVQNVRCGKPKQRQPDGTFEQ